MKMKNILKSAVFLLSFVFFNSCTNDKDAVASANGFELRKDNTVTSPDVLLEANSADNFIKLNWDRANNGVPTSSTYSIIVSDHDNDPNYLNAVESVVGLDLTTVDTRECTLKVGDFNDILNRLPSFTCSAMNIDIRIKSKLGVASNALFQYSNPITISVTGFPTLNQILAFVKDDTNPDDSEMLASSSVSNLSDFEGYCYLEPGNYKMYRPDGCGDFSNPTIYGIGTLSSAGVASLVSDQSQSFVVTEAGHYFIKASLGTGSGSSTCTIKKYRAFGPFGNATRGAGGSPVTSMVPMTYDASEKKWTITMDLIVGNNFKFKSNMWDGDAISPVGEPLPSPPYVPAASGAPSNTKIISTLGDLNGTGSVLVPIALTGGDIKVPGAPNGAIKKFKIEMSVSNPRNYTYKLQEVPN
jgi:starch-binding outer membrane protein SusE/F